MPDPSRIKHISLASKVMSARQAAALIGDGMVVGASGFMRSGDSKAVLAALAEKVERDQTRITLMTGASLGQGTDGTLATAGAVSMLLPFQSDPVMRTIINEGELCYIDENVSETAAHIRNGYLPQIDIAIIEATAIEADGDVVPATSLGNSAIFVQQARQVIIEINEAVPTGIRGIHGVFLPKDPTGRAILPITEVWQLIGQQVLACDSSKIAAIFFTNQKESPAETTTDNAAAKVIAAHLLHFFQQEIAAGRLTRSLRPLQAGIGKIAETVLGGLADGDCEHLTMYSETLQDSKFKLMEKGKMDFTSGSSMFLSEICYQRVFDDFDHYRHKILRRPQDITNAAEVIQWLGVISINSDYFLRACRRGGPTPHLLEEAFRLHANLAETCSMKAHILQST